MACKRISARVAVPVILLCGGLGVVVGSLYPPHVLPWATQRVAQSDASHAAPAGAIVTATVPEAQPEKAATVETVDPAKQEQPEAKALPAEVAGKVPAADSWAQPRPKATLNISPSRPESGESRGDKLKQQRAGSRKAEVSSREARAPRERYAAAGRSTASKGPQGVLSQIPIVGPVVNLLVP